MKRVFKVFDRVTLAGHGTRWWMVGSTLNSHGRMLVLPISGPRGGRWVTEADVLLHVCMSGQPARSRRAS